jgi:hypothetical protein
MLGFVWWRQYQSKPAKDSDADQIEAAAKYHDFSVRVTEWTSKRTFCRDKQPVSEFCEQYFKRNRMHYSE